MLFLFLLFIQASLLEQGLTSLRDGKLPEARTSFEKVLQQDPKNPFAWVSLAETCRRIGDVNAASDAAQKAEQLGVQLPPIDHALAAFYTQQGQLAHAAALEERYAASPKADPAAGLRTAELYQRAGDRASAERVLRTVWERRATDPQVAFAYAQLFLQKLDFVAAEKAVAPALKAHPQDPQLVLVTGVSDYGQRRFPQAIETFLKVIAIDPSIPQPYEFIGKMLEQAGPKLPEITKAFAARVKSAPGDALANLVLAKAIIAADAKDPAAETLLRHSLAIDPNQWEAHYELGVLLESKHAYQDAAGELSQSSKLDPKQPTPHYHLARVYERLGEPEKAKAERLLHQQLSNATQ